MKKILILIKRHLKLYFKNPTNIFISLLSVIVVLSLYFLFIRDFTIKAVIEYGFNSPYNSLFVDQLMVYGLLIVISTTSILPIGNIFIDDKNKNIIHDFIVAPLSKLEIIYSYIIAATIISVSLSFVTYIIISILFSNYYLINFSFKNLFLSFGVISISTMIASNLIFIICFFIKSNLNFSNFGNLLSVTIGFFTGVYIPIGYYPKIIRNIFFYLPLTQTTNLLRVINTKDTLSNILINYPSKSNCLFKEIFGLRLLYNNFYLSTINQVKFIFLALILTNLIIIVLAVSKKDKNLFFK